MSIQDSLALLMMASITGIFAALAVGAAAAFIVRLLVIADDQQILEGPPLRFRRSGVRLGLLDWVRVWVGAYKVVIPPNSHELEGFSVLQEGRAFPFGLFSCHWCLTTWVAPLLSALVVFPVAASSNVPALPALGAFVIFAPLTCTICAFVLEAWLSPSCDAVMSQALPGIEPVIERLDVLLLKIDAGQVSIDQLEARVQSLEAYPPEATHETIVVMREQLRNISSDTTRRIETLRLNVDDLMQRLASLKAVVD